MVILMSEICFTVPSHVDEFDGIVGSYTLESLCQDANTRASRYVPVFIFRGSVQL